MPAIGSAVSAATLKTQTLRTSNRAARAARRTIIRPPPGQGTSPNSTRSPPGLLAAMAATSRAGHADLDQLSLVRAVMLAKCAGQSPSSRLRDLLDLFTARRWTASKWPPNSLHRQEIAQRLDDERRICRFHQQNRPAQGLGMLFG